MTGAGGLTIDLRDHGHGEDHHEHLVHDVRKASSTGTTADLVCLSEDLVMQHVAKRFHFINYSFDYMMLMRGMNEHEALFW